MWRSLILGLLLFGLLAMGSWWLMQKVRGGRGGPEEAAAYAAAQRAPIPPAPSAEPVQILLPRGTSWFEMGWGLVALFIGIGLFFDPGPLRSAWLAVPAGGVLLILGAGLVFVGWPVPDGQLVVSQEGVRRQLHSGTESIAWAQVSEVAIVTTRNPYRSGVQQSSWLVVSDTGGQEFLREKLPLGPPDRWQRLLDSVPAWSGQRIQHRSQL